MIYIKRTGAPRAYPHFELFHEHPSIMFAHRTQLRRWAARMLLVWLFGVLAGIAQACVVQPAPDHAALPALPSSTGASHGHTAHDDGSDEQLASKSICLDFCDKSAVSVPTVSSVLDQIDTAAIPILYASTPPARQLLVLAWTGAPPRRNSAPPISIAFLRLTI